MKQRRMLTGGRLQKIAALVALFFCLQLAAPPALLAQQQAPAASSLKTENTQEQTAPLPEESLEILEPLAPQTQLLAEAEPSGRSWVVANVIIMLLGLLISALLFIGLASRFGQSQGKSRFAAMCEGDKTGCTFAVSGIFAGLLNLLAFLLANDMAGGLYLKDAWTLPMAALLAAQVTLVLLLRTADCAAHTPGHTWRQ